MKTAPLFLALAAAVLFAAAPGAQGADSGAPQIAPWGFDLTGRDTTAAPGADFYEYANGEYVKHLVIPPDRSRYGAFDQLASLSEERVRGILEKAAGDSNAAGNAAKIGAFYRAFMDEARADQLADKPIRPELDEIKAARTRSALATLMGRSPKSLFSSFFGLSLDPDAKEPGRYAVYLSQAGLNLPDRDYYLEPSFSAQKTKYQAYVAQMLTLIGWPDAAAEAGAIVALETEIARASWSRAEERDPTKNYNPMTPAQLEASAPGFDWAAFLEAADLGSTERLVVQQVTAVPKIAQVFAAAPIHTLQAWEAFVVADSAAPLLSKPFVDANFEFRNKILSGQQAQKPRWRRAVNLVDADMGEAVGKLYVAAYFPPESKAKMQALVADIRAALAARIQRVNWMSDATKARALEKLSKLNVKIGYPVKWRDYGPLAIDDKDLTGDVVRSSAFEWARQVRRMNGPVDRDEWGMTPQTVNAYYDPSKNEIVFPAAILQPPFFDPVADPAVNYGGIGGVIGHEMTHGFDDEGREFDGEGRLVNWWTHEDEAKFVDQTRRLGEQYSAFEPIAGAHIKGDLTMGENIADLGGMLLGLDAYHLSLKGKPEPDLDGLSGDQRVFLGWAQVWRSAQRPDSLRRQLVSDPHSPPQERVNGVVRNVDGWYAAFGVKPGDALYLAPESRVRIW
jgi:putative endopeptidase